jgi:hypothetical protein
LLRRMFVGHTSGKNKKSSRILPIKLAYSPLLPDSNLN